MLQGMADTARPSSEVLLRCLLGLSLVILLTPILNTSIFPYYEVVMPIARETGTLCHAGALVAVALSAAWRPGVLSQKLFALVIVIGQAAGIALTGIAMLLDIAPLLVIGSALTAIARGFLTVLVGATCTCLSLREVGVCVASACFTAALVGSLLSYLPSGFPMIAFALCPFIAAAMVLPYAEPVFVKLSAITPPADLSITQPSSFLPFGHHLFICLFLFRLAYGYSFTFGEQDGTPLSTALAAIPIAIVAALVITSRKETKPDNLFLVAFLLVVAGFLSHAVTFTGASTVTNTLLTAGSWCFDLLVWTVLITLGAKNLAGAVSVFAWGFAVRGLGMLLGANLGRLCNSLFAVDLPTLSTFSAIATFLFVVFGAITLKNFSFSKTIEDVLPHQDLFPVATAPLLNRRCQKIVKEHKLTQREAEVFELLARGRNVLFIQEELVISRNTVKAHVKNVYRKLNVHTQQELIDLVERS